MAVESNTDDQLDTTKDQTDTSAAAAEELNDAELDQVAGGGGGRRANV